MPRSYSRFVCQQCGYESAKWMGRCPDCGAWNSMVESVMPATPAGGSRATTRAVTGREEPVPLPDVRAVGVERAQTGSPELDRVLGGGIVPGSLVLLGGEPGIGKSTLLLQVAGTMARDTGDVLYVSAEESPQQVKMRAERLGIDAARLYLLGETDVEAVVEAAERLQPSLVIVDSIQTVASPDVTSAPGSVSQVRECTLRLMRFAKRSQTPVFIIGHVTKEGTVAGPRALEHIVDAVLYLEGERFHIYRLLRGVKNRFGATNEVGVFQMRGEGLQDVENPSALFLTDYSGAATGSAVVVSLEGTRPLLVEVQALVSTTPYAAPRVTVNGFDHNRMLMLLAVLTKRVGLSLGNQDVYANVAGGFSLGEPAADLGLAAAVASSYREQAIEQGTILLGEVGLGGELRPVTRVETRIREAAKLGFKQCILPKMRQGVERELTSTSGNTIRLTHAATLAEALEIAFSS